MGELDSRIRIRAPLRCDGIGRLDCAEDTVSGRRMAVRWLPLEANGDAAVKACEQLPVHPTLPTIRQIGHVGGAAFVAMDFPEGQVLGALLEERLDVDIVLRVASQLADALATVHAQGVVHGEMSAESVLLVPPDRAYLWDMPLVIANRLTDRRGENRLMHNLVRTAPFLSPERARGDQASQAGDIYSLGTVLCAVAGCPLPPGPTALRVVHQVATGGWAPTVPSTLPEHARAVLQRMVSADPSARPSAREVVEALNVRPEVAPSISAPLPAPMPTSTPTVREMPAIVLPLPVEAPAAEAPMQAKPQGPVSLNELSAKTFDLDGEDELDDGPRTDVIRVPELAEELKKAEEAPPVEAPASTVAAVEALVEAAASAASVAEVAPVAAASEPEVVAAAEPTQPRIRAREVSDERPHDAVHVVEIAKVEEAVKADEMAKAVTAPVVPVHKPNGVDLSESVDQPAHPLPKINAPVVAMPSAAPQTGRTQPFGVLRESNPESLPPVLRVQPVVVKAPPPVLKPASEAEVAAAAHAVEAKSEAPVAEVAPAPGAEAPLVEATVASSAPVVVSQSMATEAAAVSAAAVEAAPAAVVVTPAPVTPVPAEVMAEASPTLKQLPPPLPPKVDTTRLPTLEVRRATDSSMSEPDLAEAAKAIRDARNMRILLALGVVLGLGIIVLAVVAYNLATGTPTQPAAAVEERVAAPVEAAPAPAPAALKPAEVEAAAAPAESPKADVAAPAPKEVAKVEEKAAKDEKAADEELAPLPTVDEPAAPKPVTPAQQRLRSMFKAKPGAKDGKDAKEPSDLKTPKLTEPKEPATSVTVEPPPSAGPPEPASDLKRPSL